jgi:AcrR family transcriptional regulator
MTEEMNTRWRRRKEARPGEILEAALACFAERGFAATRLEDVAARAGITKGTLYLYFPSKEELFKAVVRSALLPTIEHLEAEAAAEGSTADLFRKFVQRWGELVGTPVSALPKLVLAEAGNFPELARFYLEEVVRRGLRLVGSVLRRGIGRGEIRPVDVEHTAFCAVAPVLFSVLWKHSLGRFDDRPLDATALFRTHLDLFLRGLRPDPPAPMALPAAVPYGLPPGPPPPAGERT